jgi:hypothetical protein
MIIRSPHARLMTLLNKKRKSNVGCHPQGSLVSRCSGEEVFPGKDRLWSIVSMLVGLIKANSDYRLHEGSSE